MFFKLNFKGDNKWYFCKVCIVNIIISIWFKFNKMIIEYVCVVRDIIYKFLFFYLLLVYLILGSILMSLVMKVRILLVKVDFYLYILIFNMFLKRLLLFFINILII